MKCIIHHMTKGGLSFQGQCQSTLEDSSSSLIHANARSAGLRNAIRCITGVTFGAFSSVVLALGLGDIQAQSYLGQPLNAKVNLVNVNRSLDPNYLSVRPVGITEASKMGSDVYHGAHVVKVNLVNAAKPYVTVTTKEAVKEPYLSVLLELRWPSGVVYREYPILLDPAPVISAPTSQVKAEQEPAPKPLAEARSVARYTRPVVSPGKATPRNTPPKAVQEPLSADADQYRVRSGDSLSRISERWREGSTRSITELNQWVFQNNPHAFINNDMNRLKAGVDLVMPSVSSLSEGELSSDAVPALAASSTQTQAASQPEATSRPEQPAGETAAATVDSKDVKGLLTVRETALDDKARELIDALWRENETLKARIASLEKLEDSEYVNTMRELVALQQDQIVDLQARLGEVAKPPEEMDGLYETVESESPALVGGQNDTGSSEDLSKQEVMRELGENVKGVDVNEKRSDVLLEAEPQGIDAIVQQGSERRSRLVTILFIVGGILTALFAAMFLFYRKMLAERPKAQDDLPPLASSDKPQPMVPDRFNSLSSEAENTDATDEKSEKTQIRYDGEGEAVEKIVPESEEAWYGEKADEVEAEAEIEGDDGVIAELRESFDDLDIDESLLEELEGGAEDSFEGLTQELPDKNMPRRSDEEVQASIAEKMAQYNSEELTTHEALSSLELDEVEAFDDAEYDEVDTIVYRAMMYCEFRKFDKARNLVETKMQTDEDERLSTALDQINGLAVEAQKKTAS